ncbi:MAG: hypothetical protein ABWK00_05880 [Desulfurococcaceae archaeon]
MSVTSPGGQGRRSGGEEVSSLLLGFVLERTERRPLTLTARKVRRLARELGGRRIGPTEARRIFDAILAKVGESSSRRLFVRRTKTGARIVTVMPPWVESPYLDVG